MRHLDGTSYVGIGDAHCKAPRSLRVGSYTVVARYGGNADYYASKDTFHLKVKA